MSSQILTAPNTRSVDQGGTLREFPEATVARPNAQGGLPVLDRPVGARVARRDSPWTVTGRRLKVTPPMSRLNGGLVGCVQTVRADSRIR